MTDMPPCGADNLDRLWYTGNHDICGIRPHMTKIRHFFTDLQRVRRSPDDHSANKSSQIQVHHYIAPCASRIHRLAIFLVQNCSARSWSLNRLVWIAAVGLSKRRYNCSMLCLLTSTPSMGPCHQSGLETGQSGSFPNLFWLGFQDGKSGRLGQTGEDWTRTVLDWAHMEYRYSKYSLWAHSL